jgi:hypothetical protein
VTPIDLKECTIFILDRNAANFIAVRVGEGNLTYSVKRNIDTKKSRGNLHQIREGEEEAIALSFQFVWDHIVGSSGDPPTVEDALYRRGEAAAWVSTSTDSLAPFCVDIQIVHEKECVLPNLDPLDQSEYYHFSQFHFQSLDHDPKSATVDCKGICNRVKPIVVRGTP